MDFIFIQGVKMFDQFLGTWILLVVIFAMIDEKNGSVGNLNPVLIGICVIVIGLSFGITSGFDSFRVSHAFKDTFRSAINPARDLGPRLYVAMKYRTFNGVFFSEIDSIFDNFWLIPAFVPYFGALFGACTYITLISAHHKNESHSQKIIDMAQIDELKIQDENMDETKNLFQNI